MLSRHHDEIDLDSACAPVTTIVYDNCMQALQSAHSVAPALDLVDPRSPLHLAKQAFLLALTVLLGFLLVFPVERHIRHFALQPTCSKRVCLLQQRLLLFPTTALLRLLLRWGSYRRWTDGWDPMPKVENVLVRCSLSWLAIGPAGGLRV